MLQYLLFISFIAVVLISDSYVAAVDHVDIKMPEIRPTQNDEYICHAKQVPGDFPLYITGFEPITNRQHVHHMLVYLCQTPGSTQPIWDCGEMENKRPALAPAPICDSGTPQLIYAWGMDANALELPKDVSFKMGTASRRYIVIQLHYKSIEDFTNNPSATDQSGVRLITQEKRTPKLAAIYLLETGGFIPSHSTVHMEAACKYQGAVQLNPFAYRVHGHDLDMVNSAYRIRSNQWTEIGRRSPQKPQIFAKIEDDVSILPGDILASRCTMRNNKDHIVSIGATKKDEMCNFYIMYWVKAAQFDQAPVHGDSGMCDSPGWPYYKWQDNLDGSMIPASASVVPGTDNPLPEDVDRSDLIQSENSESEEIPEEYLSEY